MYVFFIAMNRFFLYNFRKSELLFPGLRIYLQKSNVNSSFFERIPKGYRLE